MTFTSSAFQRSQGVKSECLNMMNMKCVLVGDGDVGKTAMLKRYTEGSFLDFDMPTVFDNTTIDLTVEGQQVSLGLWDTAGQEDYDRLRPLSYPGADCFILCFSLCNKASAENIKAKWYPEIHYHCPYAPIILIGTKLDMRQDKTKQNDPKKIVSRSEGEKISKSIKAVKYLECSALTQEGLKEVFDEAVKAFLYKKTKQKPNNNKCLML
ncbi:ras-related protein ced-10-like isoform X1 [Biomphalaria glabrata]|uniref:Ras-related protein ced-10-like isoform X1 n=1 Tax=Biomphalaria glabrata TaxID=6526 RepID=A0A9W2YRY9_BIOGL|nr:ras-related protein ced-10-like isoform X1 [Biomphalaria glabrata]